MVGLGFGISAAVWVSAVVGSNELWYAGRFSGGSTKLPPGHMGFPILGEMVGFLWYFKVLRRPDQFINAKRRKYGDGALYRTHLFGSPSVIICLPSAIKFILKSGEIFPQQWPSREILGLSSLVAVNGAAHTRLRSYVTNTINSPDALHQIALAVQPRIVAALQSWAEKADVWKYWKLFASLESGPTLDSMEMLLEGLMKGIRAMPLKLPGTAFHHGFQCRKKVEVMLRKELMKRKKLQDETQKRNDLMNGLMKMKDERGDQLSDQEVLDNIVSLILGGYEPTVLVSTWAVYYLAKYPEVLRKLREENIDLRKSKQGALHTSEDVFNMKYTNKVVEETVRLANVAAFVFRLVAQEVELEGYKIPKNWKVILWLRYLHTNSDNFDDPLCFNPDRWNKPIKPGTFMAFGSGLRICAGNIFARMQNALFLHYLSVGYKWELLNPDAEVVYLPNPKPVDGVEVLISVT